MSRCFLLTRPLPTNLIHIITFEERKLWLNSKFIETFDFWDILESFASKCQKIPTNKINQVVKGTYFSIFILLKSILNHWFVQECLWHYFLDHYIIFLIRKITTFEPMMPKKQEQNTASFVMQFFGFHFLQRYSSDVCHLMNINKKVTLIDFNSYRPRSFHPINKHFCQNFN